MSAAKSLFDWHVKAMIAAAAADGGIDEREIKKPASAAVVAKGVRTETAAFKVSTAARIAIDTDAEQSFLAELANCLSINTALATPLDSAALCAV